MKLNPFARMVRKDADSEQAVLATAIREAASSVLKDDVGELAIALALRDASVRRIPEGGVALYEFVIGPLHHAIQAFASVEEASIVTGKILASLATQIATADGSPCNTSGIRPVARPSAQPPELIFSEDEGDLAFEDEDPSLFDAEDELPSEREGPGPFEGEDQRPFDADGPGPFEGEDQRPFDAEGELPFEGEDQRPFDADGPGPFEGEDQRSFDADGPLSFGGEDQLSFAAEGHRPFSDDEPTHKMPGDARLLDPTVRETIAAPSARSTSVLLFTDDTHLSLLFALQLGSDITLEVHFDISRFIQALDASDLEQAIVILDFRGTLAASNTLGKITPHLPYNLPVVLWGDDPALQSQSRIKGEHPPEQWITCAAAVSPEDMSALIRCAIRRMVA